MAYDAKEWIPVKQFPVIIKIGVGANFMVRLACMW
jgi:hypothetical protein